MSVAGGILRLPGGFHPDCLPSGDRKKSRAKHVARPFAGDPRDKTRRYARCKADRRGSAACEPSGPDDDPLQPKNDIDTPHFDFAIV